MTIRLALIFVCAWIGALPQSYSDTQRIANYNCICVNPGKCIRPTNMIAPDASYAPSLDGCLAGDELCCDQPLTSNPPKDKTCGKRKVPPTPQTILGRTSFGAYPWQVAILKDKEYLIGTGALINKRYVLTTAHNVINFTNYYPQDIEVRLGEWDVTSFSEPYNYLQLPIEEITVHPKFNYVHLNNDVAIIKLSKDVPIATYPNINTVCMPDYAPQDGIRCYVAGWGKDLFGPQGSFQSILKDVDLAIVNSDECETRLRRTMTLGSNFVLDKSSFICAGGIPGKDACVGDGGSPLVCQKDGDRFEVVGLVSWGVGCAEQGVPGVYTNVFNYMPWIRYAMGIRE